MIADTVLQIGREPVFLSLPGAIAGCETILKVEGLNPAGSIKLRPAVQMVLDLERKGVIAPGRNTLIESSSGNLGVALSLVARKRGYPFICVMDPNATPRSQGLIKVFGGQVITVSRKDANGGYLGTRIDTIRGLVRDDPRLVWVNQYESPGNALSHYDGTARQIIASIPDVDFLLVGAGTTGTLMGCSRYFREFSPRTTIVAVDVEGSVTFGGKGGPRRIPGLGTSRRPPIFDEAAADRLELVSETDTIDACHWLVSKFCIFTGGSTGSVVAAAKRLSNQIPAGSRVVVISPDMGDAYLDTIYNPDWIVSNYGEATWNRLSGPAV